MSPGAPCGAALRPHPIPHILWEIFRQAGREGSGREADEEHDHTVIIYRAAVGHKSGQTAPSLPPYDVVGLRNVAAQELF